jgi:hypothetical protein
MEDLYRNCFAPTTKLVFRCILIQMHSKPEWHALVLILCTELDQMEDSILLGFFFELLNEIKSLDVKRTVTVHVKIPEQLKWIINFHISSSLRALSNDNH